MLDAASYFNYCYITLTSPDIVIAHNDKSKPQPSQPSNAILNEILRPNFYIIAEFIAGPKPLPTSSNDVWRAKARPRASGKFPFSNIDLILTPAILLKIPWGSWQNN